MKNKTIPPLKTSTRFFDYGALLLNSGQCNGDNLSWDFHLLAGDTLPSGQESRSCWMFKLCGGPMKADCAISQSAVHIESAAETRLTPAEVIIVPSMSPQSGQP